MTSQNSIRMCTLNGFLAACVVLFGAVVAQSQTFASHSDKGGAPKVGDLAPDFSVQDFKGEKFTLSTLTKRRAVLLWFTNLCEGCQSKISEVLELKSLYERKGVDVVAVSVLGKDRKTVEDIIRTKNVTFQFLYDPNGEATERYSGQYIEGTCPLKNILIIDKGGKITYSAHLPGVREQELTTQLENIVRGVKE